MGEHYPEHGNLPFTSHVQNGREPIAVVGFSLKFPGDATSANSFWKLLMEKRCTMTEMPDSRINLEAFYHEDGMRPGAINARGGHYVKEDLGAFDASFFSISPAEASAMDPQQRILLETAYRALENAGMSLDDVKGSMTGVYAGSFSDDYKALLCRDMETIPKQAPTGVGMTMLSARLSWFFDLRGPCVALDTACSTSLVAMDLACEALWSRSCSQVCLRNSNHGSAAARKLTCTAC